MAQLLPIRIADSQAACLSLRGGAVAIGNFDGVHRGHAILISQLVAEAKRVNGPAIVVTFDPPPATVLHPAKPPVVPLTTLTRRAELLGKLGVDAVVVLQSENELLELSAEDFFQRLIVNSLQANAMVEGPNFRFGNKRLGDTIILQQLCSKANISLTIVAGECSGEELISSTRIRSAILQGNISAANSMLTSAYQFSGTVAPGERRGRQLGFPTANLTDIQVLLPSEGVYGGAISIDGQLFRAAINVGANPTFGDRTPKVEAHLLDFGGDLYGQQLTCTLHSWIRDVKRFESVDALKSQIQADVAACRAFEMQES